MSNQKKTEFIYLFTKQHSLLKVRARNAAGYGNFSDIFTVSTAQLQRVTVLPVSKDKKGSFYKNHNNKILTQKSKNYQALIVVVLISSLVLITLISLLVVLKKRRNKNEKLSRKIVSSTTSIYEELFSVNYHSLSDKSSIGQYFELLQNIILNSNTILKAYVFYLFSTRVFIYRNKLQKLCRSSNIRKPILSSARVYC